MPISTKLAAHSRYRAARRLVARGWKAGPRQVLKRLLRARRPASLTGEMLKLNEANGHAQGVDPTVHPGDFMYWYCCDHPSLTLEQAIQYYFWDGGRSAKMLADLIDELAVTSPQPISLLEFASGYGCVTRHLKKNRRFEVAACDIHPEAVKFLGDQMKVTAIQSVDIPEQLSPGREFDVVFALSFFSHMPKTSFGRWLKALYSSLAPNGHLLFTTHGLNSCGQLGITPSEIPADGFWFSAHSEQQDLDTAVYGSTLCTPDFVLRQLNELPGASLALYKQAHWWDHQDLFAIKRGM